MALLAILGSAQQAYTPLGLSAVFLFMAVGGYWTALKAETRAVLWGGMVGAVAVALYTALTTGAVLRGELAVTEAFLFNHLLKMLGGMLGGFIAGARVKARR